MNHSLKQSQGRCFFASFRDDVHIMSNKVKRHVSFRLSSIQKASWTHNIYIIWVQSHIVNIGTSALLQIFTANIELNPASLEKMKSCTSCARSNLGDRTVLHACPVRAVQSTTATCVQRRWWRKWIGHRRQLKTGIDRSGNLETVLYDKQLWKSFPSPFLQKKHLELMGRVSTGNLELWFPGCTWHTS